jgi:hypothetical protein
VPGSELAGRRGSCGLGAADVAHVRYGPDGSTGVKVGMMWHPSATRIGASVCIPSTPIYLALGLEGADGLGGGVDDAEHGDVPGPDLRLLGKGGQYVVPVCADEQAGLV